VGLRLYDSSTSSFSTDFEVRAYVSHGYSASIVGPPPRLRSAPTAKQLTAMSTRAVSSPGIEQYGVNLRANTTPSVGSAMQQIPDSSFSFGYATADYNVPNEFKYVDGDVIARSDKSSGYTRYFISFIANVGPNTPGGEYFTSHTVVVLANY
jgi:hypothetical protein